MKVIEHKPYDHKADVFSFGIVFWELLTGQVSAVVFCKSKMHLCKAARVYYFVTLPIAFFVDEDDAQITTLVINSMFYDQLPYSLLTPLQAAVGVVQKVYFLSNLP